MKIIHNNKKYITLAQGLTASSEILLLNATLASGFLGLFVHHLLPSANEAVRTISVFYSRPHRLQTWAILIGLQFREDDTSFALVPLTQKYNSSLVRK